MKQSISSKLPALTERVEKLKAESKLYHGLYEAYRTHPKYRDEYADAVLKCDAEIEQIKAEIDRINKTIQQQINMFVYE